MSLETLRPAPTSAPPSGPPPLPSRTTLLRLAAAVLARRRFVLGLTLIGAALAAGWSLVVTPQYRAMARFAPILTATVLTFLLLRMLEPRR